MARRNARPPAGGVRAVLLNFLSDPLPVAHRGWMHPPRQLLHTSGLGLC